MIQSAVAAAGKMTQREFENSRKRGKGRETGGRTPPRTTDGRSLEKRAVERADAGGRREKVSCYAFQMP